MRTLYKADTSLKRTLLLGTNGVRFIEIPLYHQAKQPIDKVEIRTDHIFATKILSEKAITSQNYTIYLLFMLDISKALDTIDRTMRLEDLRPIIEKDELFMIKCFARSRTVSEMRKIGK